MGGGHGDGKLLGDPTGEHRHCRHPLHAEAPGRRHPANFGAHGPDDALAEEYEAKGDAEAAVEAEQGRGGQALAVYNTLLQSLRELSMNLMVSNVDQFKEFFNKNPIFKRAVLLEHFENKCRKVLY